MKRTNKIWRSLALLLVLCMLPTVALANSGATVTIVGDVTEEAGAITVNANTTVAGNDITILAFRAGETVDAIPAEAELEESLVFIEQVTSDDEGNATFSFIPRAVDASYGGYVHIYVGGENMTGAPAHASIDNRPPAPVLDAKLPTVWYAGHDTLDFAVAEDLAYVNAWAATLQEGDIKVTGVKEEDDTPVTADAEIIGLEDMIVAEGKISFDVSGLKSISKIAIDANDAYTGTSAIFSEPLVRSIIPAGTLTATPSGAVSPVSIAITEIAGAEGVPTNWAEGALTVGNYGWAKAVEGTDKVDLDYTAYTEGTYANLALPAVETGKEQYYICLEVANCETTYYGPYTVTSPLQADIDALTAKVLYGEGATEKYTSENAAVQGEFYQTIPEGDALAAFLEADLADQKAQYGKATIALDNAGEYLSSITWTMTVDGVDEGTVKNEVTIERNAVDGEDKAVVLVATIENNGNSDTKTFNLTVSALGSAMKVKEENVTLEIMWNGTSPAFNIVGAKVVTIKLEKDTVIPGSKTIMVGETALLYAPERSTLEVDVFVGILREDNADAAAVVAAIEIVDGESEELYYGRISYTSNNASLSGADAAAAIRMNKNKTTDTSTDLPWSDAQILACDTDGTGEITGADAARMIRANKAQSKAEFAIITK